MTIAKFLHHKSCDKCGSSDARGVYSDGGEYCFSCGYYKPSGEVPWAVRDLSPAKPDIIPIISIPTDLSENYSSDCINWVSQYDVKISELKHHGAKWSASNNQLVYVFYREDDPDKVGCLQARNFNTHVSKKYFNVGNVNEVLPIYYAPTKDDTLVIVEDVISAIKVARYYDSMPLLGSHLAYPKIMSIKGSGVSKVVLWLDHDKYKAAMEIREKFQILGVFAEVICTDLDPKCYSDDIIQGKIRRTL